MLIRSRSPTPVPTKTTPVRLARRYGIWHFRDLEGVHILLVLGRALHCKFSGVVGRAPIGVPVPKPGYSPVALPNVDPFFLHPIQAGLCTWEQLRVRKPDGDPVLDLADVVGFHEWLIGQSNGR